jgi:RNA recognition motif-containing protein
MQKKLYVGGLPWEIDRVGLMNYFKAILEGSDITASYEPPFVTNSVVNPNASIRVVDVFVASDRATGKSRGFGFITLELPDDENGQKLFEKSIELMNGKIMIGIRGARELIVNEADPKTVGGNGGNGNGNAPAKSEEMPAPSTEEEQPTESKDDGAFNLDF